MVTPRIPVTVTYRHPGARPPVYVAGDFSDRRWQPQKMEYTADGEGGHTFRAQVLVEAGSRARYKIRLGDGDWVIDENAPVTTDSSGSQSNLIIAPPVAESSTSATTDKVDMATDKKERVSAGDPGSKKKAPGANIAAHLLSRSARSSGASTPSFVRTATEVADSAAIVDREESEPEMSDKEAGRSGTRRLSTTPIPQVANTAAEVADVAQKLDADKGKPRTELRPEAARGVWQAEAADDGDDAPHAMPLFAHECAGMAEEGEGEGEERGDSRSRDSGRDQAGHDGSPGADDADFDDPTLERFPSNRAEIMDAVRKLEGGLNEDRATTFDVGPPSPALGSSRRSSFDYELAAGEPQQAAIANPSYSTSSRKSTRLEVPRSPHDSVGSNRSSALSLHSIDEGEEAVIAE